MTEEMKYQMSEFNGFQIKQRDDGRYDATGMCKANNKEWYGYIRSKQNKEYLDELKMSPQICGELIITVTTGPNKNRGTWIHPYAEIHLAQWISAKFAVQVTDWVFRFMSGDLSLVKEVVQRHDEINNTQSSVLVDTISKDLAEKIQKIELYETRIQVLTNSLDEIKNRENEENERRKSLTCQYCNKTYSSNSGITNHVRNNCDENKKAKFCLNIDLDRFVLFIDTLEENWTDVKEDYDFTLQKVNWESDKPKLKIKYEKKSYTYHIYKNTSRIKICNLLNNKYTIPINLLLSSPSSQYAEENKAIHCLVSDFYRNEDALMIDNFKQKLGIQTEEENEDED
jgi:KilA-N domain